MTNWLKFIAASVLWAGLIGGPAFACPNPDLNATDQLRTNGASLRMGDMRRFTAGGTDTLDGCDYLGLTTTPPAFFNAAPNVTADLSGMVGLAIEIRVTSRCPTSLLVHTAEGNWYFDDDGQGLGRPLLLLSRPTNGLMQMWVGTDNGQSCSARVTLATIRG